MYDVSERFLLYTNRSGLRDITVDVYYQEGIILENAPVAGGNLDFDRRNLVRASGSLQFADKTIDWSSLEPWGTELVIKCGILYPDGDTEYVPMGVFRLEDFRILDGVAEAPQTRFFDRAKMLEEAAGVDQDYSGWLASEAVADILDFGLPGVTVTTTMTIDDFRLPGGTIVSSSLLDTLSEIATYAGAEIWFDRDGNFHMEVIPDVTPDTLIGDAVYDFSAGINVIAASRTLTRVGAYNAVYVTGTTDGDGSPVRGFAVDGNPASLSQYGGPFGRRIERVSVSGITSTLAAQNAALELLKKRVGLMQNTHFTALLNPALDPGDIVTFFYFDNTVEIHQINSISFDLKSWAMTCGTRSVQLVG